MITIPKGFMPKKATYTLKESSAYLGMSINTVRDLITRGILRKSNCVSKIFIPGEDVETLMERTC